MDMRAARLDRRRFITTAGAAAALASGGELLTAQPASAALLTRRDISTLTASDPIILAYEAGIKAMRALSASNPNDPRGWTYQAGIHASTLPPKPNWNQCEHGDYWFWPWHRMYLYWFERIVRHMAKSPSWALPYWNYSAGAAQRVLPAMFRTTSSVLYTPNRNPGINAGTSSLPASAVVTGPGMALTNFANASSSLESTPHNIVHVSIGGWMASVPTAAQDPIFYLHHSNMDRLWNLWLAQAGGRTDPLSDTTWKTRTYTFYDENATAVHMTPCDVLRAAQQLSYQYQGEPPQVNEYCLQRIVCCIHVNPLTLLHAEPIVLQSGVTKTPISLKQTLPRLRTFVRGGTKSVLQLENIVTDRQPGVYWEVYFGPSGAAPNPAGPYFVGNLALFSAGIKSEAHHGFQPAHLSLPINGALAAASEANPDEFALTFVPRSVRTGGVAAEAAPASPVHVGAVRLSVEAPATAGTP